MMQLLQMVACCILMSHSTAYSWYYVSHFQFVASSMFINEDPSLTDTQLCAHPAFDDIRLATALLVPMTRGLMAGFYIEFDWQVITWLHQLIINSIIKWNSNGGTILCLIQRKTVTSLSAPKDWCNIGLYLENHPVPQTMWHCCWIILIVIIYNNIDCLVHKI